MKHNKNKNIIIVKKHENVLKNWLRPNFLLLPPKLGGLKIWGSPPLLKLNPGLTLTGVRTTRPCSSSSLNLGHSSFNNLLHTLLLSEKLKFHEK